MSLQAQAARPLLADRHQPLWRGCVGVPLEVPATDWLIVNEGRRSGWGWRIRTRSDRAQRGPSIPPSVQQHVERGARYQSLLARMSELGGQLQATLSGEQLALWLRLEDVFFEYAQLMAETHFDAGRQYRKRDAKREDTERSSGEGDPFE